MLLRFLYLIFQVARLVLSVAWTALVQSLPRHATVAGTPRIESDPPSPEALRDGHELSDAKPILVAVTVLILFFTIFSIMGILSWMYARFYSATPAIPAQHNQEDFRNAPRTRTGIEQDWAMIDAETHRHLDGYAWVDPSHGIVRIPIQRAMDLVASQGLPSRPGASPPPFPPPDQEKLPITDTETRNNETQSGPD